jgi:hypothetical protein
MGNILAAAKISKFSKLLISNEKLANHQILNFKLSQFSKKAKIEF